MDYHSCYTRHSSVIVRYHYHQTYVFYFHRQYYAAAPVEWKHKALMVAVCLFVCPVPNPKLRMEGLSELKIGRRDP